MEPTETSKAQQTEEAPNPMEITSESKENEAKSLPEQKHHGPPTPTASSSYVWDGNTTLDVTESTLEGEKLMQILSNNKHSTVKCEALLQDFGRDGARKLASAIEKNNSVTSLEIDSCDFGDGGLFYLTEAIAARPDVTSLMLRGLLQKGQNLIRRFQPDNDIRDTGATDLASAMKTNGKIKTLLLTGNSIGDRGLAALSEAILQTHSLEELGLGHNPFGIWGINSLVKAFVEYPSGKKLPFVHGVDWLKVVEPLKMREYTTKKFKMDGDVFDFLESLHYPSMRGIRATVIRKQAKLQADCESSFRTDTSATLREHVERAEKLEKTVLTKTEAENLSDAVASAVDAGIDGGDEFVKKSRKLLWNDAEYKLREQKMQQDIKQWKMDEKEAKRLKRLEEEERERQYRANLAKRPRGTLMLTLICWCLLATVAGFCYIRHEDKTVRMWAYINVGVFCACVVLTVTLVLMFLFGPLSGARVVALHWYPSLKACEENVNTLVQILPTDVCDDTDPDMTKVTLRQTVGGTAVIREAKMKRCSSCFRNRNEQFQDYCGESSSTMRFRVSCEEVCRDSAVVRHGLDSCPAEYNSDVVGPRSFALKDTVDLCGDFTGINAGYDNDQCIKNNMTREAGINTTEFLSGLPGDVGWTLGHHDFGTCGKDSFKGFTAREQVAYECYEPILVWVLSMIITLSIMGSLAAVALLVYIFVFRGQRTKFCKKKYKRGDVLPEEELEGNVVHTDYLEESFYNIGTYQKKGGGYHPVGTYVVKDVSAMGDTFFCELVDGEGGQELFQFASGFVVNRVKEYKKRESYD